MSQLNKKNTRPRFTATQAPYGVGVSGNGNVQAKKSPEQILFETLVSTLYGRDSYYESANDKVVRMRAALSSVVAENGLRGAEFAGRAAKFAREHMYIRTMPIVMVVELAKIMQARGEELKKIQTKLDELISKREPAEFDLGSVAVLYDGNRGAKSQVQTLTIEELEDLKISLVQSPPYYSIRDLTGGIISRADELTDLYAYALTVFKDKVPMSLRRGVADAFNKFDAYQFGKYNRDSGLKFKNLLRIVHPVPKDAVSSAVFKKIMDESLEAPYTWEVELSVNGQLPVEERKSKSTLWTELINRTGSGSMGYMAMIRNLRNMQEAGLDQDTWKLIATKISNPKAVEKSKQLPFGFINAYDESKAANVPRPVLNALQEATEMSLSNLPKVGDNVWIIVDSSGSMNYSGLSAARGAENSPIKIAAIFGAALVKAAKDSYNVKFTMFDDYAKHVDLNPRDSIFTLFEQIMARNAGGGTNLESALNEKSKLGFEPDTVFVLSDMEINSLTSGRKIDKLFKSDCVKVAVNLSSRDTTPLTEWNGWIQLAGWSPKIFQFVKFTRDAESIVSKLFNGEQPAGETIQAEED